METECYASSARQAARQLTARYDEALKPAGVTLAQFSLLRRLSRLGESSLTTLAEAAHLERSTTGRNVKVLGKLGLVSRSPGEDQRERLFELTERGHAVLGAAMPLWSAAQAAFEAEMGADRAGELRALLASVG